MTRGSCSVNRIELYVCEINYSIDGSKPESENNRMKFGYVCLNFPCRFGLTSINLAFSAARKSIDWHNAFLVRPGFHFQQHINILYGKIRSQLGIASDERKITLTSRWGCDGISLSVYIFFFSMAFLGISSFVLLIFGRRRRLLVAVFLIDKIKCACIYLLRLVFLFVACAFQPHQLHTLSA